MSQQGVNPAVAGTHSNIAQELMEEDLKREIARNEAANKMAMEREAQALEARKRAQESQITMKAMLKRYEEMKSKLENTKKHLDETNSKITDKEQITDKITNMKARIEAYASKKEAVACLNEHVHMKLQTVAEEKETPMNEDDLTNAERLETLKTMVKENEARFQKREEVKQMLEKQLLLGEKRAAEQMRITEAREKLLALKMRELELQKAALARKQREQAAKERATDDFLQMIDNQLEDMETKAKAPKEQGAVPKQQKRNKSKGKGRNRSKSNTPKVKSPEPIIIASKSMAEIDQNKEAMENKTEEKSQEDNVPVVENEKKMEPDNVEITEDIKVENIVPNTEEINANDVQVVETSTPSENILKSEPNDSETEAEPKKEVQVVEPSNPSENISKSEPHNSETDNNETEEEPKKEELIGPDSNNAETETEQPKDIIEPELSKHLSQDNINSPKINEDEKIDSEKEAQSAMEEQTTKETRLSEDEVKKLVEKAEGKCSNMRGDIADMAMSEQYLRTKQALLMAKKKEQEMKIAEKMASLREEEVKKMKEKVQQMQELLRQRKEKLQITEELMVEREGEKKQLDKQIEATKRRENYVENKIIETVMFDKPPKKK